MDFALRFFNFLLLSSIAFLLSVPLIISAISFWSKVFDLGTKTFGL